jgi:translation initiation factor IF-2
LATKKGMKVSELANELGKEPRELINILKSVGVTVRTSASTITPDDADKIRAKFKKPEPVKAPEIKDVVNADGSIEKKPDVPPVPEVPKKTIKLSGNVSVKDMAELLHLKVGDVIKELMKLGIMATINQTIDIVIAGEVAKKFDTIIIAEDAKVEEVHLQHRNQKDDAKHMLTRPPIVVVMGHVDHGKTKLLDAIRKTNVIDTEAGGITQHIGAYQVDVKGKKVTFLDTPGHEAFTALRSRGAKVTDIAVLVVAADDGIMPQTIEAIDHAKAAGVPIIVALNKIDKPEANLDRVKKQLMDYELTPEEWGGKTVTVGVSAKQGKGIDELLDMILLTAEILELKANPNRQATGIVIEAKLDKGRGPVTTVLIGNGTLKVGDNFYVGAIAGKVRALINYKGERIEVAPPSTPVEVLGADEVPVPGEVFRVMHDEQSAHKMADKNKMVLNDARLSRGKVISLEDFSRSMKEGVRKDLNIILKADVQGSLEAIKAMLTNLSTQDIRINIIHSGAGSVSESDVMLALASKAIVVGFNVSVDGGAQTLSEDKGVDMKIYNIIYQIVDDMKLAMQGLLEPIKEEAILGHAFVKTTFRFSKLGTIAGCVVKDGLMQRGKFIRIMREDKKIYEGRLESLKRFKDDAKEVQTGFECGIAIQGYNDFKEGDIIECFEIKTVLRKL